MTLKRVSVILKDISIPKEIVSLTKEKHFHTQGNVWLGYENSVSGHGNDAGIHIIGP